MIIRSQDKKSIFNLESIKSIKVGVLFKCWAGESCDISIDKEVVGTYSTEEKAIRVLDMICNRYVEPISQAIVSDEETFIYQNSIFQMPADEDVEV